MNKRLFIDRLSEMIKILIIVLIIFEGMIGLASYRMAESETQTAAESFLQLYGTQLENRLNGIDRVLGNLLYDSVDLPLVDSDDDLVRHYAVLSFQGLMEDIMKIDTNAQMVVLAEAENETCLVSGDAFSSGEKKR